MLGTTYRSNAESVRPVSLIDLVPHWRDNAHAAHCAYTTGRPQGPVTGLPKLDRLVGGWLKSGLHVLHAEPGAGKTALALQIAALCGYPALFVSCEMSAMEVLRRVTARATGIGLAKLCSGEMTPAEAVGLAERALTTCPQLNLLDATQFPLEPEQLLRAAEAVRGTADGLLVVVDSVHTWSTQFQQSSEYDRLNAALEALQRTASVLNCSALAISERNRTSMTDGGISAGAGTRRLEYAAETVLGLDRPEKDPKAILGGVPVKLKALKNRHGSPGAAVDLRFHGAIQLFAEA